VLALCRGRDRLRPSRLCQSATGSCNCRAVHRTPKACFQQVYPSNNWSGMDWERITGYTSITAFQSSLSRILWKCGRPTELYPANSLPIRLSGMVFSCGYFFSAAFQFTTTFNGGEEAPPGAGGGVDQKTLAVRGDVVIHGIIACCWHNMRVKQKPRSRRLQTRPSPQPTLSPARPSPSRPRPQRITPRRRRASGLLPTRNRYRRLPFRTRKMTAHRFHVGVRYGHGGGG